MNTVIINGNSYIVPELDFNAICDLEEQGINLLDMNTNNMKMASLIRGLAAWIMKVDQKTAANEIQGHIEAGGSISDIMEAISKAIDSSGFFRQTQETNSGRKTPMDHQKKRNTKSTTA